MNNKVYVLLGTISFEFSEVIAVYKDEAKAESIALQLNAVKGKGRLAIISDISNIQKYDEFDVYAFDVE